MLVPLFLLTTFLKQLLWVAFIPMWQFPDEQAHFAQVQNLAENKNLKSKNRLTTSKEIYESEVLLGTLRDDLGNNKYTYHPEYNIAYADGVIGIYEKTIKSFPKNFRTEYVINEATGYPPLYYILSSFFYRLVYSQDLITRVFATRLFNIVLSLFGSLTLLQIGKSIFPSNLLLQSTFLIVTTFHPMFSFVFGGINSDNLYNALFILAIYLSLKVIVNGLKPKTLIFMALTLIVAEWIKPQGKLITVIYFYPLIYSYFVGRRKKILLFFLSLTIIGLGLGFTLYNLFTDQQIVSELPAWSNLPHLAANDFLSHIRWTMIHTYREVIPWYWGVFRWLSLTYPRLVHRTINWAMVVSILGILKYFYLFMSGKKQTVQVNVVMFLLYSSLGYFLAITGFDYIFTRFHGFSFGIQGRYFFPVIVAHMSLLVVGVNTLFSDTKIKDFLLKLTGLGAIILHSYSFYFVSASYYISNSWQTFFHYASQYKPIFFKSPFLEILILLFVVVLTKFLWHYLQIHKHFNEQT